MREIKFKQAIFKNNKFDHWHYWGFVGYRGEFIGPITITGIANVWSVKPSQEYTGIHDRNSKGIYEGDICLAALPKERFPVEVVWCDTKAGFLFQWDDSTYESGKDEMEMDLFTDIEVIDNIHENQNLLETK